MAKRLATVSGFPFLSQDAHVYLVPVLAVAEDGLAGPPLLDEAALAIRVQGTAVEFEDRQGNAVQRQPREGVLEHQRRSLGSVAVPPRIALADGDVEQSRAVVAVELAARARPDQPVGFSNVDRHRQEVRAHDPRIEEALDLLGR